MDRAVSGDAPPPELESPPETVPDTESPWSSSRDMSDDICANCNWIEQGTLRKSRYKKKKRKKERNTQKIRNV